ncbi:MCE family protein [Nocardia higoensis]|uniref:MCE family protein n=1 Tax=Nocardia higoensis TaxID=228599 RepID=A0ABS0DDF9_9NOCA|nr:MCE family protein [Nocardia higoensis]MBF6355908.1 MCE family protein [Nocardia higoensis]
MAGTKNSQSRLDSPLGLKLAGLAMVLGLVAVVAVALTMFVGGFTTTATVLVQAPRSGLVLDPDAKVKVRGVEIGTVAQIDHNGEDATLKLALDPDKLKLVPANATVDIRSTTVFGAKYVNFQIPENPSAETLRAGATVVADHVTVEFNTLFQQLSDILTELEPQKLNATLAALGQALNGRGETLGQLMEDLDGYLREMNPTLPTLREDLRVTAQVGHLYADTAPDLLRMVDNAVVTSSALVDEQASLDDVLANLIGLADTTGAVLRENEQNLGTALDLLRPTTQLLEQYAPGTQCMINAVAAMMPLGEAVFGGLQPGVAMNTNFMFGAEPYSYPDDLPKVNATGGPRCEGLVDRVPGSHVNYVVTDTSQGMPYVPSMETKFNGPKVFQLLLGGLPGVSAP